MLHFQVGEFLSLLHNITKLRIAYSAKKRLQMDLCAEGARVTDYIKL